MSRLPELSPRPLRYALACLPLLACSESNTPQARPTTPPQASPPSLAAVQHPAQPEIVRPLPPPEPISNLVPSGRPLPKPAPSAPSLSDLRGDFCGFVSLALTMPQLPPRDRTAVDPPCSDNTSSHEIPTPAGAGYAAMTVLCSQPAGRWLDIGWGSRTEPPACGASKVICEERGMLHGATTVFRQFTDGILKGHVVRIDGVRDRGGVQIVKGLSYYTLLYALAEDQWGGECLEKNRRKLR